MMVWLMGTSQLLSVVVYKKSQFCILRSNEGKKKIGVDREERSSFFL